MTVARTPTREHCARSVILRRNRYRSRLKPISAHDESRRAAATLVPLVDGGEGLRGAAGACRCAVGLYSALRVSMTREKRSIGAVGLAMRIVSPSSLAQGADRQCSPSREVWRLLAVDAASATAPQSGRAASWPRRKCRRGDQGLSSPEPSCRLLARSAGAGVPEAKVGGESHNACGVLERASDAAAKSHSFALWRGKGLALRATRGPLRRLVFENAPVVALVIAARPVLLA